MISLFAFLMAGAACYQLIYALAGLAYKTPQSEPSTMNNRICVLIAAYKEDRVIVETAKASLLQYYPSNKFDIVVMADQLQEATLQALRQLPIKVVEQHLSTSTKSRAINATLSELENYDIAVVLDADNLMHPTFLQRVNDRYNEGWVSMQGQRSHKNNNSSIAMLDGISEWINNHILCKGHAVLGFSARLAGSGMAFDFNIFKSVMLEIDAIGGFDKALEGKLTALGHFIGYDHEAIIYDEKVSKSAHFAKQRGRWIMAQYTYAAQFAKGAFVGLLNGNLDHFNKFLQMTLPPRLLLPVILGLGSLLTGSNIFIWGFIANVLSFTISIPFEKWTDQLFIKSLLTLPKMVLSTFVALSWMPAARKQFLHTVHH